MAFVRANDIPVFEAVISMPRVGAWTADLVIDSQDADAFAGPVAIAVENGNKVTFRGTVYRGGVSNGAVFARVVGGANGLSKRLKAKSYTGGFPASIAIGDILREAGERLSPASAPVVLTRTLQNWTRIEGGAGAALDAIVTAAKGTWRVLRDGTVWVGVDAWPPLEVAYDAIREEPDADRWEVFTPLPVIEPGVTFGGRRVSNVAHRIDSTRVRTVVYFEQSAQKPDELKAGLHALIRDMLGPLDYHAPYSAKVVAQNGDGTLELQPDDPRLAGLSNVPVLLGLPGATVKVLPGARVLLGFANGDPQKPFSQVWESGTALELNLSGMTVNISGATAINLNGPGLGVARIGDLVSPVAGTAGPFPVAATGTIATGSATVKAGL